MGDFGPKDVAPSGDGKVILSSVYPVYPWKVHSRHPVLYLLKQIGCVLTNAVLYT